jgi:NAD(P)H dehydrogenase (quinone)
MKNVLVIYAHPDEQSFNAAILKEVAAGIKASGNNYHVIDLHKENYNPVMTLAEMKGD